MNKKSFKHDYYLKTKSIPRRKLCLEADSIYATGYGKIQTEEQDYIVSR